MTKTTHILFDFFGTLVEYSASRTDQGYERSYQILLSNGVTLSYDQFLERWSATCRRFDLQSEISNDEYSMDEVVSGFLNQVLGQEARPNMAREFRDTYLQEWNKGVKYIAEVPALLNQLAASYTLALVTNTHSADLIREHLRKMQVAHVFSAVVTSVEHGKRKPDPSIFEQALKVTGGRSDRSTYVGDSFEADYIGAANVGMRCLLIDPQKVHKVPENDRVDSVLGLFRMKVGLTRQ
jgi:putative hydrolase of the HAD superfamily